MARCWHLEGLYFPLFPRMPRRARPRILALPASFPGPHMHPRRRPGLLPLMAATGRRLARYPSLMSLIGGDPAAPTRQARVLDPEGPFSFSRHSPQKRMPSCG
ncbi:hypothetical protein BV20DRAFT_141778 [Pilatotrama ljubarskyi]|nr:hypothetical protein BV20DRAFT_141778 [Pilatotrama ljubarskyi]